MSQVETRTARPAKKGVGEVAEEAASSRAAEICVQLAGGAHPSAVADATAAAAALPREETVRVRPYDNTHVHCARLYKSLVRTTRQWAQASSLGEVRADNAVRISSSQFAHIVCVYLSHARPHHC